MGCSASSKLTRVEKVYKPTEYRDSTGSGYQDSVFKDIWGNQKVGEVGKDTNRDGYIDRLWRDTTGNGKLDTLLIDTNHDHKFDKVMKDTSDGKKGPDQYDLIMCDSTGLGYLDCIFCGESDEASPTSSRQGAGMRKRALDNQVPVERCPKLQTYGANAPAQKKKSKEAFKGLPDKAVAVDGSMSINCVERDMRGTGKVDTILLDTKGKGKFDTILHDSDGKGWMDTLLQVKQLSADETEVTTSRRASEYEDFMFVSCRTSTEMAALQETKREEHAAEESERVRVMRENMETKARRKSRRSRSSVRPETR